MSYKDHKQYRIPGCNYSEEGNYFVTICTHNREKYFGKIINGNMILSEIGIIVDKIWNEITIKFDNIALEVYQIMPDHFHGIIKTDKHRNFINEIPTFNSKIKNNPMELKTDSLGRIIRWFKGRVKFEASKIIPGFKWQSRFYDRIIRNEKEFNYISEYIRTNPQTWGTNKHPF